MDRNRIDQDTGQEQEKQYANGPLYLLPPQLCGRYSLPSLRSRKNQSRLFRAWFLK